MGVGPTKTEWSIDVPDALIPILRRHVDGRTEGSLFPTLKGRRMNACVIWRGWVNLAKELELPRRKPHTFRHSVATMLSTAKYPIPEVAAYLGDIPETVVKTYLHKTPGSPVVTLNALLSGLKV